MALSDEPDPDWRWPNGVFVGQTEGEFVWVIRQIVNWRLVAVPKSDESVVNRYWCYEGTALLTAYVAIYAGMTWSGKGDPVGWSKNGQTGEFRQREDAFLDIGRVMTLPPEKLVEYYALVDQAAKIGDPLLGRILP